MPNGVATLEDELKSLSREVQIAEKNSTDFAKRHYNGLREETMIFCLKRASDLGKGALSTAIAKLPESTYLPVRGLFEVFLQIYWLSKDSVAPHDSVVKEQPPKPPWAGDRDVWAVPKAAAGF